MKLIISLDFVPLLNSSETRITVVVMPSYELVNRVVTQKCCHTNNKPITLSFDHTWENYFFPPNMALLDAFEVLLVPSGDLYVVMRHFFIQ